MAILILAKTDGTGTVPEWGSISEGTVDGNVYGAEAVMQNVSDNKVVFITYYNGITLNSYTSTGTTINLDATTNVSTGGLIGPWDASKLEENKLIFVTDDWEFSGRGLAYVVTTGSGTINVGPKYTYLADNIFAVSAMSSTTAAILGHRFISSQYYPTLYKVDISGSTITADYQLSPGPQYFDPTVNRIDDTHVLVTIREWPAGITYARVYQAGASSWSQVGSQVALNMAGPVRTSIIQQRDDGDGIVYTMYGETAGVMQAQAIKVNSTTYGITQGAVVGLGGTINSGSQRPITRLTDSKAMATSRTTYNILSIDGSLAVTQDSSTLYTKASSGQYAEVEFLTADGSKVLHRNNFEMRIAESG